MSEKQNSTSSSDEEANKIKFDISLSSGSESSVNEEVGSEEGASVPGESVVGDNLSPSTENKPR